MADQDPIDEFIALPREQQLSTLQGLSPEKQDKLLGKVKERRRVSKGPAPRTQPAFLDPHPGENTVKAFLRGGAASVVNTVSHPIQALESQGEPFVAGNRSTGGYPAFAPMPFSRTGREAQAANERAQTQAQTDTAEQGKQMAENPAYTGGGIILPALATEGVLRGVRALAPRLRTGAQSLVGAGEKNVKPIVAKEAEAAGEAAKSAIKSNREATAQHATDTTEVKAANNEAVRTQGKIAPTQDKLKTAGRELQGQIETARNNALKIGNEKYNTVNEALSHFPADGEKMVGAVESAAEKISGSNTKPAILKDMTDRIFKNESLNYGDLQGYYSELGKELSKGTLPGDVYHALDTLHESIGDEMQRIADSQGKGAQLTDARGYWRRMKQAFGKPYNPTDVANVTLEKTTGQGAAEEHANRVRLLGSFDPSIPQTVEHISKLRKGLESLPDQKPLRDVVKPLPAKPEPKQIHPVDVNTRAIREQLLDRWSTGESQLSKFQVRSLVGGGLGALIGGIFEGKVGAGLGGVVGSTMGPAAISRLVEVPAVREWLTRPPAAELDTLRKLPSSDRLRITDTLNRVVGQSAKLGKPIKMSPSLAALIAGSQGLAPRKQEQHPTDAWAGVQQ